MSSNKIMRPNQVVRAAGISESTILRLEKKGQFPKRRRLSSRAVGWLESEINEWIGKRKAALEDFSNKLGD